jgi:CP family cyanate transporter-like MFS transporter
LVLLAIGAILTGFTLRLSVASIPPLLADLEHQPGLSAGAADVLTASPFVCFALGAIAGPRLVRALGAEVTLAVMLVAMAAGMAVRAAGSVAALLLGTIAAAAGVAVANVVLPVLIKERFPERTGLLIGCYTSSAGKEVLPSGRFRRRSRWSR